MSFTAFENASIKNLFKKEKRKINPVEVPGVFKVYYNGHNNRITRLLKLVVKHL